MGTCVELKFSHLTETVFFMETTPPSLVSPEPFTLIKKTLRRI